MKETYTVFACIGNAFNPFPRFADILREALTLEGFDDCLFQHGYTEPGMGPWAAVRFLPRPSYLTQIQNCRHYICHGGTGSVLTGLMFGKRPLVIPRLVRYGEMVDDHQLQIVDELVCRGVADRITDAETLRKALRNGMGHQCPVEVESHPSLLKAIRQIIDEEHTLTQ